MGFDFASQVRLLCMLYHHDTSRLNVNSAIGHCLLLLCLHLASPHCSQRTHASRGAQNTGNETFGH